MIFLLFLKFLLKILLFLINNKFSSFRLVLKFFNKIIILILDKKNVVI